MNKLKFEDLPQAVEKLFEKLDCITQMLEKEKQTTEEPPERILNVKEAAQFLKLTVPTIYSKISRGELPHMKRGKRVYFSEKDLLKYLQDGRRKSNDEISAMADELMKVNSAYAHNQRKKGANNEYK